MIPLHMKAEMYKIEIRRESMSALLRSRHSRENPASHQSPQTMTKETFLSQLEKCTYSEGNRLLEVTRDLVDASSFSDFFESFSEKEMKLVSEQISKALKEGDVFVQENLVLLFHNILSERASPDLIADCWDHISTLIKRTASNNHRNVFLWEGLREVTEVLLRVDPKALEQVYPVDMVFRWVISELEDSLASDQRENLRIVRRRIALERDFGEEVAPVICQLISNFRNLSNSSLSELFLILSLLVEEESFRYRLYEVKRYKSLLRIQSTRSDRIIRSIFKQVLTLLPLSFFSRQEISEFLEGLTIFCQDCKPTHHGLACEFLEKARISSEVFAEVLREGDFDIRFVSAVCLRAQATGGWTEKVLGSKVLDAIISDIHEHGSKRKQEKLKDIIETFVDA